MNSFDVPDATDWASTTLSGFVAVESPMRCQVCKEFIKTPMITSCGHTFCSECIRRSLSHNGLCPACRTPDQELKLRANKSMEEVVEAFQRTRDRALEVARAQPAEERSPKRKRTQIDSREGSAEPSKKTRLSSRVSSRATPQSLQFDGGNDVDLTVESDEEHIPDDGLVECIMEGCDARMKEADVSKHLDDVHFNPAPKPSSRTSNFATQSSVPRQSSSKPQPAFHPKPLPTLSYNLLKDKALREKLHSLGIPSHGNRPLLERRHREWMTLWNANCDATHPKSKRELLKQLDEWERTQAFPTVHRGPKESQVANKEFDGGQWASQHSGEFDSLVEKARRQVRERKERERKAAGEKEKEEANAGVEPGPETVEIERTTSLSEDVFDGHIYPQVQPEKVSAEPQSMNGVSADSSSIPTDQGPHQGAEQDEWWVKELVAGAAAPPNNLSQNNGSSEAPGAQQHPYQQQLADHQWNESQSILEDDASNWAQFHNVDPSLSGLPEFDFNHYPHLANPTTLEDGSRHLEELMQTNIDKVGPGHPATLPPPLSQVPPPSHPQYQQQRREQSLPQPPHQLPYQQYPPTPSCNQSYQNISPSPAYPAPNQQNHSSGQTHWSPDLNGNLQGPNFPNSDVGMQRMLQHGDMRNRDGSQMTAQQRLEILKRPYKRTGSDST